MERDSVSRIEIGTRFVADYELMTGYCPKDATEHLTAGKMSEAFIFYQNHLII